MRHCVSHVAEEWVAFASVVDSVDDKRVEVKTGLHGMPKIPENQGVPVLIVINKNELEDFARRELISEELVGFLVFAAHLCSCGR